MFYENSKECSVPFPYDEIDEREVPPVDTKVVDMMEFARRLVRYIRAKDRCRVTIDCLYLALGDADLESVTMTDVAERHGLTKAAISKRTKEIRQQLHLSVNANNKSAHATDRYRRTNRSPLRLDKSAVRVRGV